MLEPKDPLEGLLLRRSLSTIPRKPSQSIPKPTLARVKSAKLKSLASNLRPPKK